MRKNKDLLTVLIKNNTACSIVKNFIAAKCLIATFKDFHLISEYDFIGDPWWPESQNNCPSINFERLEIANFK